MALAVLGVGMASAQATLGSGADGFRLVSGGEQAVVCYDGSEPVLMNTVSNLFADDVQRVTGRRLAVYDARQGNILAQRSHRHPARRGLHAYLSCGHADTLERHTLACDTHLLPQILHRIVASIMGCHHLQTGWPTVHSVQLVYYTQSAHNEDLLKKSLLNPKFGRPLMSSMEFSLM